MLTLPEHFKVVTGAAPETTNGGKTAAFVSLKNALRCWVVVQLTQAVGHATAITLNRATKVDGTGQAALAKDVQLWVNEDAAASDELVRQTDAKSHAVAADVKNKLLVFGVDPVTLGAGYDVVTALAADSGQATNLWSVVYLLETRYPSANPPSAVVD